MAATKAAGRAGGSPQHTPNPETPAAIEPCEQPARTAGGNTRDLTPQQLAALVRLREQFPPEAIAKRPQPTCRACSDAQGKVCPRHVKIKCKACGQNITEAHTDLDYVGHAEITARLLEVDPTWNWEPVSTDSRGLPALDEHGGLWIRLTVCGLTRLGYGDAVGKRSGPLAVKEAIGDALRNAGMRFGMALDLWAKTDLHREVEPEPHPADPFMARINNARVWSSAQWLMGVRKDADEAGQLDYEVPGGGGVTLGNVIDGRLEHLAESARIEAEMRVKREEDRKAATEQVAAEHGVTRRSNSPGRAQPVTEQDIRAAAVEVWLDPDALERLLRQGEAAGVVSSPARPADPAGPTLGQAIDYQITELRKAREAA